MKSSIKIDFKEIDESISPVIRVKLSSDPEDARDKLLKTFFQQLGGESKWLQVEFTTNSTDGFQGIDITPVHWSEMENLSKDAMGVSQNSASRNHEPVTAIEPNKSVTYFVADNSIGFHEFLKKENIKFEMAEHHTAIMYTEPFEVDIFQLGRKYEKFYQASMQKSE